MMRYNNKPLMKTRSSILRRSSSMELQSNTPPPQPNQSSTLLVPKKSPLLEFPTSPQLIYGQEILHFSHPQHPLSQLNLPDLFTCAACKEYGAGNRFCCPQCDYQLHHFCALAPPSLKSHPFHFQHQLLFYFRPVKGGIMQTKCDACGKPIKGSAFRCSACNFQIHPCCAMLSSEINISNHPHPLKLLPPTTSHNGIGGDTNFICGECKRRRSGRVYHCSVCDYHIHAFCSKNMINGLHANGIKGREKASMLGTAARLASQVVVEFIGGLIEGLGEGVGEVFVQNIARGRANNNNNLRRN